ncbi:MAG TPA: hypothetical protein VFW33_04430, partial [Gemmataceae bacterium]|nr:hypothetical protein [Gemmataceae bacterium]
MVRRRLWWVLLPALACGCGQVADETPPAPPPAEEAPPERLGDKIDVSAADLLGRPRAELAALADEWAERARLQEQARREGRVEAALLPEVRFPLVVPVLREAHYSAEAGLSLPPYVAGGTPDSDLALHLARYGDDEAARKLLDPADAEARRRVEAARCGRSYPVEWARLMGLMLHVARQRLALGESDAATELVVLHRQLKQALDPKAAAGPLGTALLAPGRPALTRAVAAWRASKHTALLADDVEAALRDWGEVPPPAPAVAPGAARADVARLLRSPGQGHVVPALTTNRALDLLDLPLPPEGAQAVLALFDSADRLREILVTYRTGVAALYPRPRDLADLLEQGAGAGADGKGPGLLTRTYSLGGFACEAAVVSRGNPVGAFARLMAGPSESGALPRDFGAVHLDRGYEQNRARLAPEEGGPAAHTERAAALAQLKLPLRRVKPVEAGVARAGDQDATARVWIRCAPDAGAPLHETALALWAAGGPAKVGGQEDENGGALVLSWDDGRTRVTLHWPFATGEPLTLEAADVGGADPARRAADAAACDRRERQARLAAGTPPTRLARSLDYDGVRLGAGRAQALAALPRGENYVRQTVADGVLVTLAGEAPKGAPHVARQSFVRFDAAGKVTELRTRYGEGSAGGSWIAGVVNGLKRRNGAPAESPGTWAAVWADLPSRKPAATAYRWQDDLTVLTCQRDAWGVEVTLRDASGDDPAAAPAPPELLPRGPAGELALGAGRDEVTRAAGGKPQVLADGALLLAPRNPGPYDALLVYLDGDRVSRIVARHTQAAPPRARSEQLTKLLTEAWGRDARALGWPARQDFTEGQGLQGLGWHDGHTRVRLFWQEAESGPPRLYAEWKA